MSSLLKSEIKLFFCFIILFVILGCSKENVIRGNYIQKTDYFADSIIIKFDSSVFYYKNKGLTGDKKGRLISDSLIIFEKDLYDKEKMDFYISYDTFPYEFMRNKIIFRDKKYLKIK
ncbi:hypothetical protein [Aureibacter tunicatorum]|uniref:Lipoprotein n=1 Tax=Aureibacter tunicatorum TaxID=866807 RepID=A0AAE3XSS1_9BACT|nr:hypothetical protein [Aureibacter tunicatorum]MDR6242103.1 hypothetical protein [Aureibacter tunicatorum]BDD05633.1 hypothetical protein AUTU_31160 [Aureibacter tunicatorum]